MTKLEKETVAVCVHATALQGVRPAPLKYSPRYFYQKFNALLGQRYARRVAPEPNSPKSPQKPS